MSTITTVSGRRIDPLSPRDEDINIGDIAHALSNICRFAGHTREFYSVAQHSVLVAGHCPMELQLWGLLHDASEAYLCDVARPIKHHPGFAFYREAEAILQAAIYRRFGLIGDVPPEVKHLDDVLLITESRDLMPSGNWLMPAHYPAPLDYKIVPWDPESAKRVFLIEYQIITENSGSGSGGSVASLNRR